MVDAATKGNASVVKAMTILNAFTPLQPTLSIRALAERTRLPRSTTHSLCLALCEAGMLEQIPRRGYRLGRSLVGLGGQVIDRTGLATAAEGLLRRIPLRSRQEAHLAQFVDGWVVYLERITGREPRPMRNRMGLRAPAHRTGCGKAALSVLAPDVVERLVAFTCVAEQLPTPDLADLKDELATARRDGFVVSRLFQRGTTSVAAAIVDLTGTPVGAVSIAGASEVFTKAAVAEAAHYVCEAGLAISHRMVDRLGTFRATATLS
ncbi:IclR family transcriptional regulator [Amycolatopsis rhabdoformis]|uniref:IclR family transcriptional regulator n=1 Tax=Amycolatopsis rhabdoformis TaxID=1448059 RepID=A0ABZ1IIU0_9PSEU|nr:IclR family transcriptional regulator [Amycolatopsis rhabdoformis]WSE34192.1 IclR family transcriptional regulator [Amycolatopsis rhabdoformis]